MLSGLLNLLCFHRVVSGYPFLMEYGVLRTLFYFITYVICCWEHPTFLKSTLSMAFRFSFTQGALFLLCVLACIGSLCGDYAKEYGKW